MIATKKPTLLEEVSNFQTLKDAWYSLNKFNKSSQGLSGQTIKDFSDNLESNLQSISDQLKKRVYKTSPYRGVTVDKGKTDEHGNPEYRPIKVAEIKDRVVFKAIANVVGSSLSNKFNLNNEASFAYQKKIGVEDAVRRMVKLYQEGRQVVLEADIQKFFDSINMERLLREKVFPELRDESLNALILEGLSQEIGQAEHFNEFQLRAFEKTKGGIPQGSALSPLLSNIALADFDQRMLSADFGLVRYADDFIVMCRTEDEAKRAFEIAQDEIENKLNLKLYRFDSPNKPARIIRPDRDNFTFLSIRFRGNELFPDKSKLMELKEKIRAVCTLTTWDKELKRKIDNDVLTILQRTNNLLCGWLAAFSYTDIDRYFDEIDEYVNKEVANILRQMDWTFKSKTMDKAKKTYSGSHPNCLSLVQRRYSGIHTCNSFFSEVMTDRDKIKLSVQELAKKPTPM